MSCLVWFHSHAGRSAALERIESRARLVRALELTDLCLFTEARYTRHPTQADRHAPFQDHPVSLEHFPTGSLIGPPQRMRKTNDAALD
ncbi:hypothetical protein Sfum_2813 [Syntrophobacter fumaroxidans MPOB]|uniref:Uncharacterized protein n=1 Tax=Syntrophobacter fumaroxidans (strain DSM 10017 / MPOB) TaxID=335543 RepID=A0LM39_SYNFM|nr:hypothetical protein Sfum_2813 [Syntrophobacter fumaroxidans MPOB]